MKRVLMKQKIRGLHGLLPCILVLMLMAGVVCASDYVTLDQGAGTLARWEPDGTNVWETTGVAGRYMVEIGPDDNVYLGILTGSNVQVHNGETGALIGNIPVSGIGRVLDLTFDDNGDMYIAPNENRVIKLTAASGYTVQSDFASGEFTSVAFALDFGADVTGDGVAELYVQDGASSGTGNTLRVINGVTGVSVNSWAANLVNRPWGLTCGSDGRVYVCGRNNDTIGVWNADGSGGQSFSDAAGMNSPMEAAEGPNGTWYVANREAVTGTSNAAVSRFTDNFATFDAVVLEGPSGAYFSGVAVFDSASRGAAHTPVPTGSSVDSEAVSSVSWYNWEQDVNGDFLDDPNITAITGYDVWWSVGVEPNYVDDTPDYQAAPDQDYTPTTAITYDTTYYWRVDSYVTWDSNDFTGTASLSSIVEGAEWKFTTGPDDLAPNVTAGNSYITWLAELPQGIDATVDDRGEGDLAGVAWSFVSGRGVPSDNDMLMVDRPDDLGNITWADPNLLRDMIVARSDDDDIDSDVMTLTLSGLTSGSYDWLSYHYDARSAVTGGFELVVLDSAGSTSYTGVVSGGAKDPNTIAATINSDGSDVTLLFIGTEEVNFKMNGFELTSAVVAGDPLFVDFSVLQTAPDPNFVMDGYQGYLAVSNDLDPGSETYSAFGGSVTLTPSWYYPGLTLTPGGTLAAPTAVVDRAANLPDSQVLGDYVIQATATDDAGNEGSDILEIQLLADSCDAAKAAGNAVNDMDFDGNCVVDLEDFADFAAEWLDDINLTAPAAY